MAGLILAVDDDRAVLNTLCKSVRSIGMDAEHATSGAEALQKVAETKYDLILMDINMQGMDGFQVIEKMRQRGISIPIIVVTARKEDCDTLYGLDIGADDYVTKPFNPVILGAKIKALLRRSNTVQGDSSVIKAGPFTYNSTTLRLYKDGTEIVLTAKENTLMKMFLDNVNRIFSKDMIYEMVWGDFVVDENAVMVYINRLRQKIEDDPGKPKYIQNVRGVGYRFVV